MIDETNNVDLVTIHRQRTLQHSHEEYQYAVAEGRLVTRSPLTEKSRGTLNVGYASPPPLDVASTGRTENGGATSVSSAADPEVTWRYMRLTITAGLVVLLFVVWIWQKKKGR